VVVTRYFDGSVGLGGDTLRNEYGDWDTFIAKFEP
jgi:hypothetical protein